jgi:hypothetical protein
MKNLKLVSTDQKIVSENYPYGFREKTTKTDYLEFSPKHGFRHCSQTINPKTGRPNNPKKSTYYDVMVLGTNEEGHCKSFVSDFNGEQAMQRSFDFLSQPENFALFTPQQIEYFYMQVLIMSKVSAKAQMIYCGSSWEDLKPYFENPINEIMSAIKTKGTENRFNKFVFDWVAINNLKIPNYQPFVTTQYEMQNGQFVEVK